MKAMSIDRYAELLDTPPRFPMTENDAASLLADLGFVGGAGALDHLRTTGAAIATRDAWGRDAIEKAVAYLNDVKSFKDDVFASHALNVSYEAYCVAYLAACERVRAEYPFALSAGMFGDRELVPFEWFVKTFYPPMGNRDGVVKFELRDDMRAKLDAQKAARPQA